MLRRGKSRWGTRQDGADMRFWRAMAMCGAGLLATFGAGEARPQFFRAFGSSTDSQPPSVPFDPARTPPAPDYAERSEWVSLPDMHDPADDAPPGVRTVDQRRAKVAVFFLYPTVFTSGEQWNADTRDADLNARVAGTTIREQASVFNGCCAIYAPRYRQMTLGGYVRWSENSVRATEVAYSDVARAFRQFLIWNRGRPFILAGHSQGSRQGRLLIEREIDGRPVARQMIAAYLIGAWIERDWFRALRTTRPCQRADDTGCVVAWSSYAEGHNATRQRVFVAEQSGFPTEALRRPHYCINPLDWSTGSNWAPARLNKGGWLHGAGPLPEPIEPRLVAARCDDGALYVTPPSKPFVDMMIPIGNYHKVDYNLAYMNLRENAGVRAAAFLRRAIAPRTS